MAKARGLTGKNIAMFGKLPIVIFIGDFYQFPLVIGRPLWDKVCIVEDYYGKMLWKSFNTIIILI